MNNFGGSINPFLSAVLTMTLSLLAPSFSDAASYSAFAAAQACEKADSGETSAVAQCDLAFARANLGSLGVEVGSLASFDGASTTTRTGTALATSGFNDVLYFEGLRAGTFTVPMDFSGNIKVITSGPGSTNPTYASVSGTLFNSTGSEVFSVGVSLSISESSSVRTGNSEEVRSATFSIVDGKVMLLGSMEARAFCGDLNAIFSEVDFLYNQGRVRFQPAVVGRNSARR